MTESDFIGGLTSLSVLAGVDRYSMRFEDTGDSSYSEMICSLVVVDLHTGGVLYRQKRFGVGHLPAWAKSELLISGKLVMHLTHSTAGRQLEATDVNVGVAMDHIRNSEY